ncbi:hypothetical protein E2C01_033378 [Portunus trituberculatus]|uniref:Uncharacterized protein n=1 Tax=Portunus trituberculatus TaxID=210409 RepID=A0A5B7F3K9_PORTR|nr:hypothetical protein [Portunus trituberculatus]
MSADTRIGVGRAHRVVNRPTLAILQHLPKVTGLDFPATLHTTPRTACTDDQVDTAGGVDVSGGEAGLRTLVVGLKRTSRPRRPRPGVAEREVTAGFGSLTLHRGGWDEAAVDGTGAT